MELLLLGVAVTFVLLNKGTSQLTQTSRDVPRYAGPAPLPPAGPSGSPNGQPRGAAGTILGAVGIYQDKVTAGLTNIIDAARSTDSGQNDNGDDAGLRDPPPVFVGPGHAPRGGGTAYSGGPVESPALRISDIVGPGGHPPRFNDDGPLISSPTDLGPPPGPYQFFGA